MNSGESHDAIDPLATVRNSVPAHAERALATLLADQLAPGLYVVATPIGNLGDISLRALAVLARAQIVLAEDTRHSRKLLSHFGVRAELGSYHEHNARAERPRILARLRAGFSVALICDAGTPLISDPGHDLVREARALEIPVTSIPGPSAALAALTGAGLPTDRFFFEGFLPARRAARRKRLEEIATVPATLVLYEAPSRVAATLADMADVLGPRDAAAARELTKLHEETVRGRLPELAAQFAGREAKGEFVLLAGPPGAGHVSDAAIREALQSALGERSLRDAVREVADELGLARSRVYKIGLALKDAAP